MSKFNLTFSGEIVAGVTPRQARSRFGKMFQIQDPERIEKFFSGDTVTLRRNLDRKTAAQYYSDMQKIGLVAALVRASTRDTVDDIAGDAGNDSAQPAEPRGSRADAGEEDARCKMEEDAARKEAAEDEARRKAEALRQQAAAEDARRKAGEQAREQAEQQARQNAQREARAQAARKKAAEDEARRKAREEAAQKKAAEDEARRRAREEAAQKKAAEDEARRRAREEAAQKKAAAAEARRKARQEAAQKKAAAAAARREAKEEAARKKEQSAQGKTAKADTTRRATGGKTGQARHAQATGPAGTARQGAAGTERETATPQSPQPGKDSEAPDKPAAKARRKRAAGGKKSRGSAAGKTTRPPGKLPAGKYANPGAGPTAEPPPTTAEPPPTTAKPPPPAATPGHSPSPGKSPAGRVVTRLDVPRRNKPSPQSRKRQPGEPNLYQLRPFRHSARIKARAGLAHSAMRRSFSWACVAVAALVLLSWRAATTGPVQVIDGASVVAVEPGAGPLLVAGNHLIPHDRAGVAGERIALDALGLVSIDGPMAFTPDGTLVAWAQPAAGDQARESRAQLVRCDLDTPPCRAETGLPDNIGIDAFVINPIDGSLLIADAAAGELLKIAPGGTITARAGVSVPAAPVLALHSGLLFMNSALGPAVSVFRYDDNAFGQQLDEVLLLPPPALQAGQTVPVDLVRLQDTWWISLRNPQTGSQGFYRYDGDWNYLGALAADRVDGNARFVPWGRRMLLHERTRSRMQRFNAQGEPEVAFVSTQLEALSDDSHRRAGLVALAWRVAFIALVALAALALLRAHLQRLRALVYKSGRERGAEPVEDHADELVWVDPAENRRARLRQRGASYGAIVLAAVALAISREVDALVLGALLVAAAGPAIALLIVGLRGTGNIARLDRRLLLVDHRGIYQLAGGSRVQHRGGFLVIDDVIVHTGNRLLPAFSPQSFMAVAPRAIAGAVRVDRNTILVKLLEARHPLAQGGIAIIATTGCALCLLALRGIF